MHASLINMNIVTYYLLESMGDEPRKNNTRANKGSPLLSEEVPYQITLIGLSQGIGT